MDDNFAPDTAQRIEDILRLRRSRVDALGDGLFSDPAWDILLQLLAARLRGKTLSLAGVDADVPESTLERWASVLEERGLIRCEADPAAPAVLRIMLSPSGALRMSRLMATLHPLQPAE